MRIAYFSDTFLPQINGVSNTLSYLKRYLDKHNIEHQFHVPDYEDAALNADPNVFCSKGIPLPIYSDCRLSLPWLPTMNSALDAFQPDFIHLATEFGIGICGRSYARAKQIPIVSSYHTNIDHYIQYYPSLSPLKSGVDDYFKGFTGGAAAFLFRRRKPANTCNPLVTTTSRSGLAESTRSSSRRTKNRRHSATSLGCRIKPSSSTSAALQRRRTSTCCPRPCACLRNALTTLPWL